MYELAYLKDDSSAALILVLHKELRVFPLLVRTLLEELAQAFQGQIVAVEVKGHTQVDVTRVQLHVDLLVNQSFAFLGKVLTHSRSRRHFCCLEKESS